MSQQEESPATSGRAGRKRPARRLASLALFTLLLGVTVVACGGAAGQQSSEEPSEDESRAGSDGRGGEEQAAAELEHPSLGDEDAPVVMTEYADYQ